MGSMRHVLARTLRAWLACAALTLTFVPAPGLLSQVRDVAVQTASTVAPARAVLLRARESRACQAHAAAVPEPISVSVCSAQPVRLPDPSREFAPTTARYLDHCALLL